MPAAPYGGATKPDNYLWQSIVVLVLCCWLPAIPAIINATKVDSRWAAGDVAGAQEASRKARTWAIVSVATGATIAVVYLAAAVLISASSPA